MKLSDILAEISQGYNAWKFPSTSQLKLEYRVEHEYKGRDIWPTESDFLEAVSNAEVETITPAVDSKILRRSHTQSYEDLLDLIKGYASYPKYRNEDTLRALYDAFENNEPMDMPIVLRNSDGSMEVFSGNTRMDVAFQLGIVPKAIVVETGL